MCKQHTVAENPILTAAVDVLEVIIGSEDPKN
jgi:hypothetical protein